MNEIATIRNASNVEAYRASTDAAELCKAIVVATSSIIQKRRYVSVEGWQAIARAHGCAAGASGVERVEDGVRAIGEVRDILTGSLVASAEGFVGKDEPVWFGGGKDKYGKPYEKRPDYAIRAMAQTRAMSRACRSAFAHVVVMMNAGLQTTPAEEVPSEGFDRETGEIIDAPALGSPPPRTKLDGPHTSKTALKAAVTKIDTLVRAAKTVEQIDVAVKEGRDTIRQADRDWPELLTGVPDWDEHIGLKVLVANRRAELTPVERSEDFKMCLETLEQCTSANDLAAWFKLNAKYVETLDGEESRIIQTRYDELEAALKLSDQATVGA